MRLTCFRFWQKQLTKNSCGLLDLTNSDFSTPVDFQHSVVSTNHSAYRRLKRYMGHCTENVFDIYFKYFYRVMESIRLIVTTTRTMGTMLTLFKYSFWLARLKFHTLTTKALMSFLKPYTMIEISCSRNVPYVWIISNYKFEITDKFFRIIFNLNVVHRLGAEMRARFPCQSKRLYSRFEKKISIKSNA